MCTSVEDLSNTPKAFLTRCVPYLKFQRFVFHLDEVRSELNAHCNIVIFSEIVVNQSFQNAWFAYSWVADDDYLEQSIKTRLRSIDYLLVA